MASTVWKGHLSFGLVSVPIRLVAAARPVKVSFHMVNPQTGSRIQQKTFDASTGKEIKRSELVKAAELDDGRTVYLTDDDLKAILPASSKQMEVLEFVKLEDVDPVYFDASYYLLPDGQAGDKPYHLLTRALEEEDHAAIAKMVRSQREYLVLIRPSRGGLTLHTLFYEDEVRGVDGYGEDDGVKVDDKELKLARMFIQAMAAEFEPEKYEDSYRNAVVELLQAKAEGQTLVTPEAPAARPTGDLMEALKASLGMIKKPPQKEKETAHAKEEEEEAGPASKGKARTSKKGRAKKTG
jgi:DNA end-binding protein Ku